MESCHRFYQIWQAMVSEGGGIDGQCRTGRCTADLARPACYIRLDEWVVEVVGVKTLVHHNLEERAKERVFADRHRELVMALLSDAVMVEETALVAAGTLELVKVLEMVYTIDEVVMGRRLERSGLGSLV